MIAGYYRSWIYPQCCHTGRHITSYRQLRVKDLPKVPMWQLEWDSNQRLSDRIATMPQESASGS